MRVISGSLKGKKIFEPKDNKTRPLKDLAKESIFNIIEHSNKFDARVINSNILDLFSGVGSFGIECLSRGSKKVVFIENYSGVLQILKKNLSKIKLDKDEYLFHAGTIDKGSRVFAVGGRVLNFISLSENLTSARDKVINKIDKLNWDEGFYRKDIGYKVIDEWE